MLNIQKPEELIVDKLTTVIYGSPGTGKTSLSFTADAPLLLDFSSAGSHRASHRKDTIFVKDYKEVQNISKDIAQLKNYKSIVIDDVGSLIDLMTFNIVNSGKKGVAYNGVLAQQGWGELKLMFQNFYTELKKLDKDIVFIAHDREKEVVGERPLVRPDISGGTYSLICKYADTIAYIERKGKANFLNFAPGEKVIAKNCADFESFEIPNYKDENFEGFYAKIIQLVKDNLNSKSKSFFTFCKFRETISTLESVYDFQNTLESIKTIEDKNIQLKVKGIFANKMKSLGFKYDKVLGKIVGEEDEVTPNTVISITSKTDEVPVVYNKVAHIDKAVENLVEKKVEDFRNRISECKTIKCFELIYKEWQEITAPAVHQAVGVLISTTMKSKNLIEVQGKITKIQDKQAI